MHRKSEHVSTELVYAERATLDELFDGPVRGNEQLSRQQLE